jgi:hypothetical protein
VSSQYATTRLDSTGWPPSAMQRGSARLRARPGNPSRDPGPRPASRSCDPRAAPATRDHESRPVQTPRAGRRAETDRHGGTRRHPARAPSPALFWALIGAGGSNRATGRSGACPPRTSIRSPVLSRRTTTDPLPARDVPAVPGRHGRPTTAPRRTRDRPAVADRSVVPDRPAGRRPPGRSRPSSERRGTPGDPYNERAGHRDCCPNVVESRFSPRSLYRFGG